MQLVSLVEQEVEIEALAMRVHFGAGETIHTESSVKYDKARVHRLLAGSNFEPHTTYVDADRLFAVHLARVSEGRAAQRATASQRESPSVHRRANGGPVMPVLGHSATWPGRQMRPSQIDDDVAQRS
jgi:Histidine-specific methyltransferase, SAM-dependent